MCDIYSRYLFLTIFLNFVNKKFKTLKNVAK